MPSSKDAFYLSFDFKLFRILILRKRTPGHRNSLYHDKNIDTGWRPKSKPLPLISSTNEHKNI